LVVNVGAVTWCGDLMWWNEIVGVGVGVGGGEWLGVGVGVGVDVDVCE